MMQSVKMVSDYIRLIREGAAYTQLCEKMYHVLFLSFKKPEWKIEWNKAWTNYPNI